MLVAIEKSGCKWGRWSATRCARSQSRAASRRVGRSTCPAWLLHTQTKSLASFCTWFLLASAPLNFHNFGLFQMCGYRMCLWEGPIGKTGLNYMDAGQPWPDLAHWSDGRSHMFLMQIAVQLFGRGKDVLAVAWLMEYFCNWARTNNHVCEQEFLPFTEMVAPRLYRQWIACKSFSHLPNDT